MNAQLIKLPTQPSEKKGVAIGCKFTGKRAVFQDTINGVYWESLPRIEGDDVAIQNLIIPIPMEEKVTTPLLPGFSWLRRRKKKNEKISRED